MWAELFLEHLANGMPYTYIHREESRVTSFALVHLGGIYYNTLFPYICVAISHTHLPRIDALIIQALRHVYLNRYIIYMYINNMYVCIVPTRFSIIRLVMLCVVSESNIIYHRRYNNIIGVVRENVFRNPVPRNSRQTPVHYDIVSEEWARFK